MTKSFHQRLLLCFAIAGIFYCAVTPSPPELLSRALRGEEAAPKDTVVKDEPIEKVLVYITTHMSPSHIEYFTNCWEYMVATVPLFHNADFMLHTTENLDPVLLKRIFPSQKVTEMVMPTMPKQSGAIKALTDGFTNKWFKDYDWLIRVNPDVLMINDTWVSTQMRNDQVDGVFVNCLKDLCESNCAHNKAHTDFFAVRPSAIEETIHMHPEIPNAEKHFTASIQHIIGTGQDRWMTKLLGVDLKGQCRTRGPTSPVQHEHGMEKYCPMFVVQG